MRSQEGSGAARRNAQCVQVVDWRLRQKVYFDDGLSTGKGSASTKPTPANQRFLG